MQTNGDKYLLETIACHSHYMKDRPQVEEYITDLHEPFLNGNVLDS